MINHAVSSIYVHVYVTASRLYMPCTFPHSLSCLYFSFPPPTSQPYLWELQAEVHCFQHSLTWCTCMERRNSHIIDETLDDLIVSLKCELPHVVYIEVNTFMHA